MKYLLLRSLHLRVDVKLQLLTRERGFFVCFRFMSVNLMLVAYFTKDEPYSIIPTLHPVSYLLYTCLYLDIALRVRQEML